MAYARHATDIPRQTTDAGGSCAHHTHTHPPAYGGAQAARLHRTRALQDYDHVTLIAASRAPSSASAGTANAEHAQSWLAQLGKGVQTLLNLPPLRSTQAGSASASAGEIRCASLLARFGETAEVAVLADDYDEYRCNRAACVVACVGACARACVRACVHAVTHGCACACGQCPP